MAKARRSSDTVRRLMAIGVPRWLAEKASRAIEPHGVITTETGDDPPKIIVTLHEPKGGGSMW